MSRAAGGSNSGVAWRSALQLFRELWRASPGQVLATASLRALRAALPLLTLWIGKLVVDSIVAALNGQPSAASTRQVFILVAVELSLFILGFAANSASMFLEGMLSDTFTRDMSVRLIEHAASMDLAQFEDAGTYNKIERARREISARLGMIAVLFNGVQQALALTGVIVGLTAVSPLLLLPVLGAAVPIAYAELRHAHSGYALLYEATPARRELDYLRYVGASDATIKETKLFGLKRFLAERYRTLADGILDRNRRLALRYAVVTSVLGAISGTVYYACYAYLVFGTLQGALTLGTLTFVGLGLRQVRDLSESVLFAVARLFENALQLRDLFDFFTITPTISAGRGTHRFPRPIRRGLTLESVGFRYPGRSDWALRDVSLEIQAGESLAIVGENGAGKSTLTKLLVRLYDPTEGRILLDGRDLREYDLEDLHANMGVLFQDFVRYEFSLRENIGIGDISNVHDDQRIRIAASKSGVNSFLDRLKNGYEQRLGVRFENGVQLSGGEWQKVALARAHMRQAQFLVFDEPTASLDAESEAAVFKQILDLSEGRTAVLVSHRLSTVRNASRIAVFEYGRLLELDTHDRLLSRDRRYAQLFALQAKPYL